MKSNAKLSKASTLAAKNVTDINLLTWSEIAERSSAEKSAEGCLSAIMKNVESAVCRELYAKPTSCQNQQPLDDEPVEDKRLVNWKRWLTYHKKESKRLEKSTFRHHRDLLLNINPNELRKVSKCKEILEKSNDKFGALSFWKLPEKTAKELYSTLPKSKQVNASSEIVYTQTPILTLSEQGIARKKTPMPILTLLQTKIQDECKELYEPLIDNIALKGNAFGDGLENVKTDEKHLSIQLTQNYSRLSTIVRKQVLAIQGIQINDDFPDKNILIDLVFEGLKRTKHSKTICFENFGEIAMNLSFKKAKRDDHNIFLTSQKSFFFEKLPLRLIPGDAIDIEFHFNPIDVGVFKENWILNCEPEFSRECEICIELLGHCLEEYKIDKDLMKIESEVTKKATEYDVEQTIKDSIELALADEPTSAKVLLRHPVEDAFRKKNPKLFYSSENVENLQLIFNQINPDEVVWDFDVDSLYQMILTMTDQDTQKQLYYAFLENFNELRNLPQNSHDDETSTRLSMARIVIGTFFEKFEADLIDGRESSDLEKSIKLEFVSAINNMICILES